MGELQGLNDTWIRDRGLTTYNKIKDFNGIQPGVYTVNSINILNHPVALLGTLVYWGTTYGTQIYTPIAGGTLYYRTKDVGDSSWTPWRKITGDLF